MNYKIVRDGYFFHALNTKTGAKSPNFTSASQAGLYIQRKAGKEAHAQAADEFMTALRNAREATK